MDAIISQVAQAFGVTPDDLTGPDRTAHIVWARQAAAHVLRMRVPGASVCAIGRALGNRDHSTIVHALSAVPKRRQASPTYDQLIRTLEHVCNTQK